MDGSIGKRYHILCSHLDERTRRLWAGSEAIGTRRGGISRVSRETGLSRTTVRAGVRQLQKEQDGGTTVVADSQDAKQQHLRRAGAGRKRLQERDPVLERINADVILET